MIDILILFWMAIGIGAGVHIGITDNNLTIQALNIKKSRTFYAVLWGLVGIVLGPLMWIHLLKRSRKILLMVNERKDLTSKEIDLLTYVGIRNETHKTV